MIPFLSKVPITLTFNSSKQCLCRSWRKVKNPSAKPKTLRKESRDTPVPCTNPIRTGVLGGNFQTPSRGHLAALASVLQRHQLMLSALSQQTCSPNTAWNEVLASSLPVTFCCDNGTDSTNMLQSKYTHTSYSQSLTFISNRTGSACSAQGTQEGWEQPGCGNCNWACKQQPSALNKPTASLADTSFFLIFFF